MNTNPLNNENLRSGLNSETTDLHDLFVHHLKCSYWAEQFLDTNYEKITSLVTAGRLSAALSNHQKEVKIHIKRIEEAFAAIGEQVQSLPCIAIQGLIDEAREMIGVTDSGSMVRDVCIIACMQKIAHYEIACYGTLRTLAMVLGYTQAGDVLEQTLNEEKTADAVLTGVAENFVNEQAAGE